MSKRGFSRRMWVVGVAGAALLTTGAPAMARAARTDVVEARVVDSPSGDATNGSGLVRDARCGNALRIAGVGDGVHCSHGPDPAPDGTTIGHRPSTDALYAAATSTTSTSTTGGSVPCSGDGVSGERVQAVYARASDVSDRYADVAPLIAQWAGATDAVFVDSAAETGGVRHVRWVTDSACALSVQPAVLSPTGDDNLSNTINELRSLGFNRTDRKYLVWMDAAMFCGMSEFRNDDSAGASNANNFGPAVSRVDSICWGKAQPVEAHELMHSLGGVQPSAPHSTGAAHCTDESDLMCYGDSSGLPMDYVCPTSHEGLFDCNHDDYFSTSPSTGSYLATHWNTAASVFLDGDATSAGTAPPPPSPTSTATYTGSLSRKSATARYPIAMGYGTASASVTFGKRANVTLSLVAPNGSVLASASGTSPLRISAPVAGGTHSVVVSSSSNATFTLDVTYPAP